MFYFFEIKQIQVELLWQGTVTVKSLLDIALQWLADI